MNFIEQYILHLVICDCLYKNVNYTVIYHIIKSVSKIGSSFDLSTFKVFPNTLSNNKPLIPFGSATLIFISFLFITSPLEIARDVTRHFCNLAIQAFSEKKKH